MPTSPNSRPSRKGQKANRWRLLHTFQLIRQADTYQALLQAHQKGARTWWSGSLGALRIGAENTRSLAHAVRILNAELLADFTSAQAECLAIARQYLGRERGGEVSLERLTGHLRRFGPLLFFSEEEGVNDLIVVWLDLWGEAIGGNQKARKQYRQIIRALGLVDAGPSVRLTDEQSDENKRKSTLQAIHDRRASAYCDRLWVIYQERTARPLLGDVKARKKVADNITKEHSRGGPAKQEGIRLFLELVVQDLTSRQARTVRNNSR